MSAPRFGKPLSAREEQVLGMVMDGMWSTEIGLKLGIQARTVDAHMVSVHVKLGARTRAHAVALFLAQKRAKPLAAGVLY